MKCPECSAKAACLSTRQRELESSVTRRYQCPQGHRFSTQEKLWERKRSEAERQLAFATQLLISRGYQRGKGRGKSAIRGTPGDAK